MFYLCVLTHNGKTWIVIKTDLYEVLLDKMYRLSSDNPHRKYALMSYPQLEQTQYRFAYQ